MSVMLTALIFAAGILSVVATLLQTWREQGGQVLALANQMHGSRAISHMHFIVRAPNPRGPVNRRAMAIRLLDVRYAVG